MTDLFLRDDFARDLEPPVASARALLSWASELADRAAPKDIFRNKEGRKTLRFTLAGRDYFLKLHSGVGWGEIVKNLLQLRLPVISAHNEFAAVKALQAAGVDTLSIAAFASEGRDPAAMHSLLVTDDLVGTVSLEDFCADWARHPPTFAVRLRLTAKLADTALRMHGAGINHRDFYLCHFHLDPATLTGTSLRCYLIDLHRAQLRAITPRRWLVKDLAGLYFSAMDCGISQRDLLRFMRLYTPGGLRRALGTDAALWREVDDRARRLYQAEHGRQPPAFAGPAGR